MRVLLLLVLLALPARADWLYVTSFQRGELLVFDLASGSQVGSIPVEDKAGIIGFDLSSDGRRLYVMDGLGRLRVLDTADWRVVHTSEFPGRALMLGGTPVTHLLRDRWLLVNTYDYPSAAAGVRVFDTKTLGFLPVGLRVTPTPRAFVGDWAVAGEVAYRVSEDLSAGPVVRFPFDSIADLAAWGDKLYVVQFGGRRLAVSDGQVVDLPVAEDPRGGSASLAVWENLVAVQRGARVWLLDRASLKVLREVELPAPGDALAFSGDGLLAFAAGGRVLRVPLGGGGVQTLLAGKIAGSGPPLQIRVAPAPAPARGRSPRVSSPPMAPRQTRIPRR